MNIDALWEISPAQLKQMLDDQQDILIVDVRRENEWNTARIEGATLIPLNELAARVTELSAARDRPIVTLCHHGVRSLRAAEFLRRHGFSNVHSMAGGIEAWSLLIDPNVPRY